MSQGSDEAEDQLRERAEGAPRPASDRLLQDLRALRQTAAELEQQARSSEASGQDATVRAPVRPQPPSAQPGPGTTASPIGAPPSRGVAEITRRVLTRALVAACLSIAALIGAFVLTFHFSPPQRPKVLPKPVATSRKGPATTIRHQPHP